MSPKQIRRVGRRRFGESLSLGGRATRCKNDWGFAESVKPRSRTDMWLCMWYPVPTGRCAFSRCSLPGWRECYETGCVLACGIPL
ncbi:hypothetical protein EGJ86_10095 [Pseudomonas sp. o96-267]|nr:hypothetical protein EGJ86_10095 [Pseudomonas sp. o96-267]